MSSSTDILTKLSTMEVKDIQDIEIVLKKMIHEKKGHTSCLETESKTMEPAKSKIISELNLKQISDNIAELVLSITDGEDPQVIELSRCTFKCGGSGICEECKKLTCLYQVYGEDRICIPCEVRQIKEGRRVKVIDRM